MRAWGRGIFRGSWIALVASLACDSQQQHQQTSPPKPLGGFCSANKDCASGSCVIRTPQWAFCSQPCQTDADCGPKSLVDISYACGVLPDGSRACVPDCMGGNFA